MKLSYLVSDLGYSGGGVSQVVNDLRQTFAKHEKFGIECHSFGSAGPGLACSPTAHPLRNYRMMGFGWMPGLKSELHCFAPDIIHIHGLWMYISVVAKYFRERNTPLVISPHGMLDTWALQRASFKKQLCLKLFEQSNIENAACIHALTETEVENILVLNPRATVCLIPNGVTIQPKAISSGVVQSQQTCKKLTFISRIHPKKGVMELVDAWSQIQDSVPDWSLDIYGWGEESHVAELNSMLESPHLQRVRFHGPVYGSAKNQVLANSTAYILPSYSEGLPVAILEAWSFGLPVLMTKECNLSYAFGSAAFEIHSSTASLMDDLRTILNLPIQQIVAYGKKGRTLVENQYSWEKICYQYSDVYRWILKGGSKPPTLISN